MKLFCTNLLLLITVLSFAQPGTLDNSFGNAGKVISNFSFPRINLTDAILQSDEKILAAGAADYDGNSMAVIVRYNSNGTLDNSFNGTGILAIDFTTGSDDNIDAIELQPDGKIVALVSASAAIIVRLKTDGSFDSSFNSNGKYFAAGNFYGRDIKVLSNNQIVVLGQKGTDDATILKLNSNGTVDSSFGVSGYAAVDAGVTGKVNFNLLSLQTNGKFVLAGSQYFNATAKTDILIARLTATTALDNSFGTAGIIQTDPGIAITDEASRMFIQSDGKIVVGCIGQGYDTGFVKYSSILRYDTSGVPDNSFDGDGKLLINSNKNFVSLGIIEAQPDGKILSGGFYRNKSEYEYALTRLNTNGSFDNSFGTNGITTINMNNGLDYGGIPLIQSDNNIIFISGSVDSISRFVLSSARFDENGNIDNSFGSNGKQFTTTGFGGEYENAVNATAIQSNGKLITAGKYFNGFTYGTVVSRYTSNGIFDNSFGINGSAALSVSMAEEVKDMLIQPDGKIILSGNIKDLISGYDIFLLRLNSTGKPDASFGTNGKVVYSITPTEKDNCLHLALQSDGKILLVSSSADLETAVTSSYLLRFNTNGSIDSSFDDDGKLNCDFRAVYVAVPDDQSIIITGTDNNGSNLVSRRYDTNGAIDNTFNSGNQLITDFSAEKVIPAGMELFDDNKIVLACNAVNGIDGNTGIAIYKSDGTPDASFSSDGKAVFDLPYPVRFMKRTTDGAFILSGTNETHDFAVSKITSDGTTDNDFGMSGSSFFSLVPNHTSEPRAISVQEDGNIILAGLTTNGYDTTDAAIIRINNSIVGYIFINSGNWSNPSNWLNNLIPPNPLPNGMQVIIDPTGSGECMVDTNITVENGGKIIVKPGKKFSVQKNLVVPEIIQQ